MSVKAQQLLEQFELLPEADRREVAAEILRRVLDIVWPPISEDELILNAEGIFLELDERELTNGSAESR